MIDCTRPPGKRPFEWLLLILIGLFGGLFAAWIIYLFYVVFA